MGQHTALERQLRSWGCAALLLMSGAWALGFRTLGGQPWWQAIPSALSLVVAGSMFLRLFSPEIERLPETTADRFRLVQPWLLWTAVCGGLVYWFTGSARLSFWSTLLGVGFTVVLWPSAARVEQVMNKKGS